MAHICFFIPAYNCMETIAESVDSIMGTNFESGDELVIVNDFSTDNTSAILKNLKEIYPAIILIDHKRNKGGGAARNTAIENAGNELLFCLDADNVLAPSSILPLKNFLLENNADVASFQYQHCFLSDKTKPEYIFSLPDGVFNLNNYFKRENTPGQHGNYLFTKSSWFKAKGYAEGTGALDTFTFGLRQAITGAKMMVLKDTFYYHRLNYENSYWMRDTETNLWSASLKTSYALLPFFEIIDERYLDYMLGKGRYTWFHNMDKKPLKLVKEGSKNVYYGQLQTKIKASIYPKTSVLKKVINKLKRNLGFLN